LFGSSFFFLLYSTVFCTLGTTRAKAGTTEDFVKINKEYVINAAKLIVQQNPSTDLQFFYCSSAGANANSSFLYLKTKGEIEKEITEIGFKKVCIFQPGFLKIDKIRDRAGFVEWGYYNLINWFDYIIPKIAIIHVNVVSRGKI
jgi:oxidoreductase